MMIKRGDCHLIYRHGRRGTVEILDIQVPPDKRRRGTGTELLREMESEVGGAMTIYLFSREENLIGHRFYESKGYKKMTTIEGFYTSNAREHSGNAVLMVKKT